MVDLRKLKEIKYKAEELGAWTKEAFVAEETIMQISKYIKDFSYKRLAVEDLKHKARFDLEIAKLEKHRAAEELKKSKALDKMKDVVKEIVHRLEK